MQYLAQLEVFSKRQNNLNHLYNPMNNPKVSIRELVASSSLGDEQRNMWDKFLEKLRDEEAQLVLESLQDHSQNLQLLTSNLQKKIEAIQSQDSETWKDIIEDEKLHLAGLDEEE